MSYTIDKLRALITGAMEAATLETASFGFPEDRVTISRVFGGEGERIGEEVHPTDYIREKVRLHHGSWIIGPLKQALQIVEENAALIDQCEKVRAELARTGIPALVELARAGKAG